LLMDRDSDYDSQGYKHNVMKDFYLCRRSYIWPSRHHIESCPFRPNDNADSLVKYLVVLASLFDPWNNIFIYSSRIHVSQHGAPVIGCHFQESMFSVRLSSVGYSRSEARSWIYAPRSSPRHARPRSHSYCSISPG
jgi:hypothetical protein